MATLKWVELLGSGMVQNPNPDTPCMKCGMSYCLGDWHDSDMCWFYREMNIHDRGKIPRKKSSCHAGYVALVEASNYAAQGEDYDGFPFQENFSDEQLQEMWEAADEVPRHIE